MFQLQLAQLDHYCILLLSYRWKSTIFIHYRFLSSDWWVWGCWWVEKGEYNQK